ncbi:class I SAM-dependent methyltransferase [Paenibacillus campi]|uniref:class I SAM-dependent methyltransferase n=1 Tax=Paenibacillus campi TaxID=3106031 RepID=UPI002AFEA84C|nr:class I SAM-dependent methyltransferase [Paenibacillus sp. SGZ-1009]
MNIPDNNSLPNINRFNGFHELYDRNRPQPPLLVTDLLTNYLQKRPQRVLDVGCGTGLSTMIWAGKAAEIIGVDANTDMLGQAQAKLEQQPVAGMSFQQAYSNELPAADTSVDIVTCSQCFHWMEPVSTLQEVQRVLTDGGIFAAYDCDWPPVLNWQLEREYYHLSNLSERLLEQYGDPEQASVRRDKATHLHTLEQSGHFRFVREIVFHHTEPCSAERYVGLWLSQGGIQAALKLGTVAEHLESEIGVLKAMADDFFRGGIVNVLFSYRMRLGIK